MSYHEDAVQPEDGQIVVLPKAFVLPRVSTSNGLIVRLDLLARVEARIPEVAFVTPAKAPELLATLNAAWRDVHELVTMLRYELGVSLERLKQERDHVLLDEVPRLIEEKGLVNAKDIREALVDVAPAVQRAQRHVHDVTCVEKLMEGKLKSLEMAYASVKKILGERQFDFGHNSLTSGSGNAEASVGDGQLPSSMGASYDLQRRPPVSVEGFGTAKL